MVTLPRKRQSGTIAPNQLQHTLGHQDCPACELIRRTMQDNSGLASTLSFREAAEQYIEIRTFRSLNPAKKSHFISERTLRDYKQYAKSLNVFFSELQLSTIDLVHIRGYQLERSEFAGAPKINQEIGFLQQVLRRANLWSAYLEENYEPLSHEEPDVARSMTPAEQDRFLTLASSREEWSALYHYCLLALHTTMSNCEMRGLKLGDFNMDSRIVQVRNLHAKNKFRVRTIPLDDESAWAAERLMERAKTLGATGPQHFLFPFRIEVAGRFEGIFDADKPMSNSGMRKGFEALRDTSGVPWLRLHDLRHCAITRMAEAGVPAMVIMSMAGHVSQRMLAHYTSIAESAKRLALAQAYPKGPARVLLSMARKAGA